MHTCSIRASGLQMASEKKELINKLLADPALQLLKLLGLRISGIAGLPTIVGRSATPFS
jgi:hypothetical protein